MLVLSLTCNNPEDNGNLVNVFTSLLFVPIFNDRKPPENGVALSLSLLMLFRKIKKMSTK